MEEQAMIVEEELNADEKSFLKLAQTVGAETLEIAEGIALFETGYKTEEHLLKEEEQLLLPTPEVPKKEKSKITFNDLPEDIDRVYEIVSINDVEYILSTMPVASDGLPLVHIIKNYPRKITIAELVFIKAMADIFPGECEIGIGCIFSDYCDFDITLHVPETIMLNNNKRVSIIKDAFVKMHLRCSDSKKTCVVYKSPEFSRTTRTLAEHVGKQTFATVAQFSDNDPGAYNYGCLGSSDLGKMQGMMAHQYTYDVARLLLFSVRGYIASEFGNGTGEVKTPKHMVKEKVFSELEKSLIIKNCAKELRNRKSILPVFLLDRSDGIKISVNTRVDILREHIEELNSLPRLLYDPFNDVYGTLNLPEEVLKKNNSKKLVREFRKRDIYYKIEVPDHVDLVTQDEVEPVSFIVDDILKALQTRIRRLFYASPKLEYYEILEEEAEFMKNLKS